MADSQGATGASPSPSSTSGVSGASPAQSSNTAPTSKPSSSAQPSKMDYGMGPSSGKSQMTKSSEPELYGEDWWSTHGEGVFKHEKFRELNDYKKKYSEVEPIKQFVDRIGGFDRLQDLHQVVGPVYNKLLSLGDNAVSAWGKIMPYLNAFLNDQDLPDYGTWNRVGSDEQVGSTEEEDPFSSKLKPFEDKINGLEKEIKSRNEREFQQNRNANLNKYADLFMKKLSEVDPSGTLTVEDIAPFIIPNIGQNMPTTADGQYLIHPLDMFNEAAFNKTWDEAVKPKLKKFEGFSVNRLKVKHEDGGPTIPDTSGGPAVGAVQKPYNRQDAINRMMQGLNKLK